MQLFQAGQRHATSHKIEQRCIPKTSRATVQRNAPCCNVRHALVAQFCRRCDIVYHYSVLYTSFEITDLVVRWSWCLLVEIFNCICLFEQFSMTEFSPTLCWHSLNFLSTTVEFPNISRFSGQVHSCVYVHYYDHEEYANYRMTFLLLVSTS